jgi:hypothetical protein
MDDRFYLKLVSPMGEPIYVRHMPCLVGSENPLKVKLQALKESTSSSINFKINKDTLSGPLASTLDNLQVSYKLTLGSCKSIANAHFILYYDFDAETFRLMALHPLTVNGETLTRDSGFVSLKQND